MVNLDGRERLSGGSDSCRERQMDTTSPCGARYVIAHVAGGRRSEGPDLLAVLEAHEASKERGARQLRLDIRGS